MTKTVIKNSLRAYISGSHLEFAVLLHGEMIRLLLFQLGKQQIHRGLKLLVILSGFRCVDKVQQGDEVALLRLRLIPNVADEGRIV